MYNAAAQFYRKLCERILSQYIFLYLLGSRDVIKPGVMLKRVGLVIEPGASDATLGPYSVWPLCTHSLFKRTHGRSAKYTSCFPSNAESNNRRILLLSDSIYASEPVTRQSSGLSYAVTTDSLCTRRHKTQLLKRRRKKGKKDLFDSTNVLVHFYSMC